MTLYRGPKDHTSGNGSYNPWYLEFLLSGALESQNVGSLYTMYTMYYIPHDVYYIPCYLVIGAPTLWPSASMGPLEPRRISTRGSVSFSHATVLLPTTCISSVRRERAAIRSTQIPDHTIPLAPNSPEQVLFIYSRPQSRHHIYTYTCIPRVKRALSYIRNCTRLKRFRGLRSWKLPFQHSSRTLRLKIAQQPYILLSLGVNETLKGSVRRALRKASQKGTLAAQLVFWPRQVAFVMASSQPRITRMPKSFISLRCIQLQVYGNACIPWGL